MKYKISSHYGLITWEWISFLPSAEININNPICVYKNFEISVHFLCFHYKWVFVQDEFLHKGVNKNG